MFQWQGLYFSDNRSLRNVDGIIIDDIDIEGPISQLKSEEVNAGIKSLAEVASGLVRPLMNQDPKPASLSVDVGLEISAGGKLVVVHGDVRAHIKLTINWSSK